MNPHDATDPVSSYRDLFHFPRNSDGTTLLYFCGNSLGLQPTSAFQRVQTEMTAWANMGVDGHFKEDGPWYGYHELLTGPMARIVGALPEEVVVMNSLTVNLHLLMVSFYRPTAQRFKIAIEATAFPSDRYACQSQANFHGYEDGVLDLTRIDGPADEAISTEEILQQLDHHGESISLVLLGGVNYLTGQAFDIPTITRKAHEVGAMMGVDLAHGAGNIPLSLHEWGVDFAAWCSYKYLNSGPGALSGVFVHERHLGRDDIPRFAGWWGHEKKERFKMEPTFKPMATAEAWQLSNPPILPMACMRESLALFDQVGMETLTAKSKKLTTYLEAQLREHFPLDVTILTPSQERGAQLSIKLKGIDNGFRHQLRSNGVIADFREPDVMRLAPVPLYNTFGDIDSLVAVLQNMGIR